MSHALATVRHDGRRPSVTPGVQNPLTASPGGATNCGCGVSRSHHLLVVCRRFAVLCFELRRDKSRLADSHLRHAPFPHALSERSHP